MKEIIHSSCSFRAFGSDIQRLRLSDVAGMRNEIINYYKTIDTSKQWCIDSDGTSRLPPPIFRLGRKAYIMMIESRQAIPDMPPAVCYFESTTPAKANALFPILYSSWLQRFRKPGGETIERHGVPVGKGSEQRCGGIHFGDTNIRISPQGYSLGSNQFIMFGTSFSARDFGVKPEKAKKLSPSSSSACRAKQARIVVSEDDGTVMVIP